MKLGGKLALAAFVFLILTLTLREASPVYSLPMVEVSPSTIYVVAGEENDVTFTITVKSEPMDIKYIQLTFQGGYTTVPVVVVGSNTWIIDTGLDVDESLTFTAKIYASPDAAGNAYSGQLTVVYDAGGSSGSYTCRIGVIVVGKIDLQLRDVVVSPSPIPQGSQATITASLLNLGNAPAKNVIVKLEGDENISQIGLESYVGEVGTDALVPFSLKIWVSKNCPIGDREVKIKVTYQDERRVSYEKEFTTKISITKYVEKEEEKRREQEFYQALLTWVIVAIVLACAAVAAYIYWRRRRW